MSSKLDKVLKMDLSDPRRMINEILNLGRFYWFIGKNTYYISVEDGLAKHNFIETKIHWAKDKVITFAQNLGKDLYDLAPLEYSEHSFHFS